MSTILRYLTEIQETIALLPEAPIRAVVNSLLRVYHRNGKVFIMGNGGSAATASHFACDLTKGTLVPGRRGFRVLPLTDAIPLLTAWANDCSYDDVFANQLALHVEAGDAVIGISASGNSPNVLRAMHVAREADAITIGFTGLTGGSLRDLVDICLLVPSTRIEQVEDAHLVLQHLICSVIRQELAGAESQEETPSLGS